MPGLLRAGTLLVDLRADSEGTLGGSVELRGELGALKGGEGETVLCAPRPTAVVTRKASITGGRSSRSGLRLRLGAPEQTGDTACGVRFPLGEHCEGRGRDDGGMELTCGSDVYLLRRIDLSGTWVFDEERADRGGDTVTQRLRIHITQSGARVTGLVDDIRTHVSGDEQSYRCNGRLRYDRQARHRIVGLIEGLRIRFTVVGSVPKKGPCQGAMELPATFAGQWKPMEDHLVLSIGDDERTLWRRSHATRSATRP